MEVFAQYLDVAVSGRKEGRPQLQVLMRAARSHAFDCVLLWKLDRFARSVAHLLRALEGFNHLGIRFMSVQDQIGGPEYKASGWLWRVEDGGWAALERLREEFVLGVTGSFKEYLVAEIDDCVSIIAHGEPKIEVPES